MADTIDKRSVLLITTLGSFLTPFMGSSVNIALPSIGKEFEMDAVLLSWVATSFLLSAAIFLIPSGRIADIYGRKKVFTYGVFIYIVASFISAISTSSIQLISFRFLQGIGGAMIFSTSVAILTSVFPPGERGKALGINVAAVYMGLSLGPFLGGVLTQHLGWRSIFFVNVPFGMILVGITFWKLKREWTEARGERFDLIGSIIYSILLSALIYGFTLLPEITGAFLILLGTFGIIVFIKWEARVDSPILHVKLFKENKVFAFSNMAALINYSATFAISFLLSLYLQYIKGLSPQSSGLIILVQPVVQAIFSPFTGRLSDRIEPRIVASTGMLLTTIGLGLLTVLNENTGLLSILLILILLGFGFALFSSPNMNAIMSSVKKGFYGVASATLGTMRLIGQTFSMGIVTFIFSLYVGKIQITFEYYPLFIRSIQMIMVIFTLLCFGGIFASLARGTIRKKHSMQA